MPNIPSTPEVADFLARLLIATRSGNIQWESGEGAHTLEADLGDGYLARLIEVEDFDTRESEPDHILSLTKDREFLFSIDRRVIGGEELSKALGEDVQYSFAVFSELWRRAFLKSRRITEHLAKVNAILGKRLAKRGS